MRRHQKLMRHFYNTPVTFPKTGEMDCGYENYAWSRKQPLVKGIDTTGYFSITLSSHSSRAGPCEHSIFVQLSLTGLILREISNIHHIFHATFQRGNRFLSFKIAVLWGIVLINHELPGVILKPTQNWHEWMGEIIFFHILLQ